MAELIERDISEEDTLSNRYLTFRVDKEVYGIELKYVTEIVGVQPITEIPEMPEFVRGIMNLRGRIIPVMDLRLRFKKPFKEYNDRTCIIVAESGERVFGFAVDSVSEVTAIPPSNIDRPPDLVKKGGENFILGIGKVNGDVKLLLDCEKLLDINIEL
ncbi:MAG TPA: chemotaxis protein CheW [Bacillota bacterium]|nr:chemotaxis protein CheW [Bacillota bacterium]